MTGMAKQSAYLQRRDAQLDARKFWDLVMLLEMEES
jgi:hypothetical protein